MILFDFCAACRVWSWVLLWASEPAWLHTVPLGTCTHLCSYPGAEETTNPECPGEVPCPSTQQGARALLQPCGSKTSHLHAHKQILSWLLPWQLCTPSLCWGGGCILERCPPNPALCLLCTPRPILVRGTKRCQVRGLGGTVRGLRQQMQGANSPCLC